MNVAQTSDILMYRDADIYAQKLYNEDNQEVIPDDLFLEEGSESDEHK